MTKKRAIIIATLIALVGGLGAWWFFATFEKVEEEVTQPPAGEARTNSYLALERFLNSDGWQADTILTISNPAPTDTLTIVTGSTADYGPEQIGQWGWWVEDGGHLVLAEPPPELRRAGDMTEFFGFGVAAEGGSLALDDVSEAVEAGAEEIAEEAGEIAEEAGDEEAGGEVAGGEEAGGEEAATEEVTVAPAAEVHSGAAKTTLDLECHTYTSVDATREEIDRVWVDEDGCLVAASRPYGDGRVTILTDIDIFSNTRIREVEHAALAHDLFWQPTTSLGNRATIALYGERISWIDYLWGLFWPTAITLLIIFAFALLSGTRRFGPFIAPVPTARRERTEHIIAIGRYLWKHESADALFRATQEALLHRVGRGVIPTQLDRDETAKWLAERTGITVVEARRILAPNAPSNPQVFADLIKSMEDLRRR